MDGLLNIRVAFGHRSNRFVLFPSKRANFPNRSFARLEKRLAARIAFERVRPKIHLSRVAFERTIAWRSEKKKERKRKEKVGEWSEAKVVAAG